MLIVRIIGVAANASKQESESIGSCLYLDDLKIAAIRSRTSALVSVDGDRREPYLSVRQFSGVPWPAGLFIPAGHSHSPDRRRRPKSASRTEAYRIVPK